MKNKKNLIIIISLFVMISIVLIFYFINKKNNITFVLNGEDRITIDYAATFTDPGFVAKDGYNNDINSYVTTNGKVDSNTPGVYKITYELKYNDIEKTLVRNVIVRDISINNLSILLNGDSEIYLLKGSTYKEEGAYVYNNIQNIKFEHGDVDIYNNVNTKITGTYEVNYRFKYNGGELTASRKVFVFDIIPTISPETITPGKVKISLNLDSIQNYSNTKLPNGETILNKNIEYEVSSNGEYEFVISLLNKQKYTKTITVNNIIANYTCQGEITSTGTKITVSPLTNEVKEYEWIINNNSISKGSNTYSKDIIVKSASVNLTLNNNEKYKVNCSISDKLVYHFKYDANNTKPFMKCNTYTSQDKARLDNMLKQVVSEAGYGTRAGVVAAARFLVGGLDYKLPYKGGVYYNKVGLNIGQSNAWGCSGMGLDCYSFVVWARAQNGLPDDGLYRGTKYSVASSINNIKVGDYLLTPCTSSSCKNVYRINHIGIVIGIDNNSIYVAENTTGNINALVVTKISKSNPPKSGPLSLVKHVNYTKEGNVSNMWMSE